MTPAERPEPDATVLITTRDRRDRLREALLSAVSQTAHIEIVVLDDASCDGTDRMVPDEFPHVKLMRSEQAIGCPAQRNRGFAIARGAIVICLDDDAWFSSPDTVAQVLAEFDDAAIGVVTIPYLNVRREHRLRQIAPSAGRWVAGTFAGGASAIRRDAFTAVGGYADFKEHGEETDLAVRLLDRGHVVRLGRADRIVHDEAQLEKPARSYLHSSRNHLVGVWRNAPWPYLPGRLAVVAAKALLVGISGRQPRAALEGIATASRDCVAGRVPRAPVRRATWVLARKLIRRGPLQLEVVSRALGDPRERPLSIVSILTTHVSGGAEFAAVDMLDALARRGAHVRLLTNRPEIAAGTHVDVAHLDLGPKLRRRALGVAALRAPLTLAQMIAALRRETPIDVLLLHYKKEQLLGALLPRSLSGSIVWAEWGPLPAQMRRGPARRAYALASRSARAIVAESDVTARSLIAAGVAAEKIVVVPNVLDSGHLAFDAAARGDYRQAWGLKQDAFVLGCITRLDPAKRVDVVIDALEHLDDGVALVIAGEGEHERELKRRAAPYGARVTFAGGARGRVAQILSACDVQVYAPGPSEGAARAVTFGQLVGRPVIATASEGARGLVVEGTGTIVSPEHDAQALATCIERYRSDPARVADEGAAGRKQALARIDEADTVAVLERALRAAAHAKRAA